MEIMKKKTFQNDLDHIYAAYRYCASCIPSDEQMERFYKLFKKVGEFLTKYST